MALDNSRIYDELIEILGDRMFQMPTKSFMDEHCLIFDPSIDISRDHQALFHSYQEIARELLYDFCKAKRITFNDIISSVKTMYAEPDLREVFGEVFEPVLSAADFDFFNQAMIRRNIVIQEQVLRMILMTTGVIPRSLVTDDMTPDVSTVTPDVVQKPAEHLSPQSDSKNKAESKKKGKGNELRPQQDKVIEQQRKQLEQEMRQLALDTVAAGTGQQQSSLSASSTAFTSKTLPVKHHESSSSSGMTSAEAAQKWIHEAQQETTMKSQRSERDMTQEQQSKLDAAELKRRQQFLREQRDKILALRQTAHEKQLDTRTGPAEKKTTASGIENISKSRTSGGEDSEKLLAKRRALAAKLKQEVVDKN